MSSQGFMQQSRKVSKDKNATGGEVKLGRTYELCDGRIGVVKFIGKTFFKAGVEWIGLELTTGDGKNNGTVQGTSYFSCEKKGKRGVFVQAGKIKQETTGKRGKSIKSDIVKEGALATGRIEYETYDGPVPETGGFLEEKNATSPKIEKGTVQKKDGAIATGRFDYDSYDGPVPEADGFLAEKNRKSRTIQKGEVQKKMGAIDTGRIDYEAAQYEVADDGGDYLKERVATSPKVAKGTVQKKDGAIATGRIDYDAANFKVDTGGDYLAEKVASSPKVAKGTVGKKDGALATGRNENYDAYKFDKANYDDGGDFLESKETGVSVVSE